jgi:hypothetical protein
VAPAKEDGSAPPRSPNLPRTRFNRASLVQRNVQARLDLWLSRNAAPSDASRVFILGCGRSGTTILGQVLDLHSDVSYFYEPKGRWAMVEPKTDIMGRYYPRRGGGLLDAGDVGEKTRARFNRLFRARTPVVIDKSPDGVFRFEFLSALDPEAKFIHIVRDGIEVADSIAERAKVSFPLLGRHRNNNWWGIDNAKWQFLRRVAADRSYLVAECGAADTDAEWGLCEWLLGLQEIRIHREELGPRLLEVRYVDLVGDPGATLPRVASFLGLASDDAWLAKAMALIRTPTKRSSSLAIDDPVLQRELARGRQEYGFGS